VEDAVILPPIIPNKPIFQTMDILLFKPIFVSIGGLKNLDFNVVFSGEENKKNLRCVNYGKHDKWSEMQPIS